MRKIRILHLITELVIGGAQDNTLLSVEGMDRHIYEVDIAGAPGGAWVNRASQSADALYLLPHMRREISPPNDLLALAAIYKLVRDGKYHIVHTHSSKAGILGRVAARLARTPIVIHTVHGFPFNDNTYPDWLRCAYLWLERLGAHLSDQLVMVADLNREEALRKRITSPRKMTVIHSGLDLACFTDLPHPEQAKAALGLPSDARVVGTVGRISACNAPLVLIEAAKYLLSEYDDLHVLIVGDGEMRSQVEVAIGDERRIHLLGFRSDVPKILPAMDVFMFPNLWGGLGRSVTEALAASVPVVAFPVNGVPELVEDGITGLHARVGDAFDLAAKTSILLKSPEMGRSLAAVGRLMVYEHFSAEKMVADLDSLYCNLLARAGVAMPFDSKLTGKVLCDQKT